jgi:formyl-CoA transferase
VESSLSHAIWEAGLYLTTGEIAIPRGTRHRLAAPYEALKTADGFIVVGVNSEDLWERLCDAVGLPELKADARFNTLKGRLANRDALEAALEAVLTQQPTDHWIERFGDEGVPCGPVNDIGQAVEDPHIQARGLFQDVDGVRYLRTPVTMSETPVSIRGGAPAVGQHTREVLKEAGLPESQIAALEADGVIQVAAG